jgi:hypothetical protein
MKTFLIVAGLLMTGASVYGVVDYNKKAGSNEFKNLYKESPAAEEKVMKKEEAPPPVAAMKAADNPAMLNEPALKKEVKKKVPKKKKAERVIRLKEFSRSKLG